MNLHKWLSRKPNHHIDESANSVSPNSVRSIEKEMLQYQLQQREIWARNILASKLEPISRVCCECGETQQCYIDDYICYFCRDRKNR